MEMFGAAKSFDDEDIPEDTEVEITEIDGVKAVVKRITADKIAVEQ